MEAKEEKQRDVDRANANIQRNINYDIEKSKGITRKRKKIDRNSRVKLRVKYEKAMKQRSSKVQEYKEGPKGKYGGETTGLKSNLIKSTILS